MNSRLHALAVLLASGAGMATETERVGISSYGPQGEIGMLNAHTGTHIDASSHFGLQGQIYNGFKAGEHLGDRGWRKGVDVLPESCGITVEDIQGALRAQNVALEDGDVVMVRTGRMRWFKDNDKYMHNTPGLTRASPTFWPIGAPSKWIPVHSAMLSQRGVPIMQNVNLESLAADRVYQFAWFGAPLKLRGSDGAPMRPVAIPIR